VWGMLSGSAPISAEVIEFLRVYVRSLRLVCPSSLSLFL
jgi:hypothetical protein